MPLINIQTLGGTNRLLIGIFGAGPSTSDRYVNFDLKKIIQRNGGKMYSHAINDDDIYNAVEKASTDSTRHIVILGYSMGGAKAIHVVNELGRDNIKVHTAVTIDPVYQGGFSKPTETNHPFIIKKHRKNPDQVFNFYQRSIRMTAGILPKGDNPYFGNTVQVPTGTNLTQRNLSNPAARTFTPNVITHLNIVRHVLL